MGKTLYIHKREQKTLTKVRNEREKKRKQKTSPLGEAFLFF